MIIHENIEQGTPEWLQIRCGLATASEFGSILANGRGGAESKTRRKYLMKLAAEIISGQPLETFKSQDMLRGNLMEAEARDKYAFMRDAEPRQITFVTDDDRTRGCSPDSFLGNDGALEIKTQRGDLLIETFFKGEFPIEHKPQCQGILWVAEREWIDIAVYWPNFPLFVRTAYRDEAYISELAKAVDIFNNELAEVVHRMRQFGAIPVLDAA